MIWLLILILVLVILVLLIQLEQNEAVYASMLQAVNDQKRDLLDNMDIVAEEMNKKWGKK